MTAPNHLLFTIRSGDLCLSFRYFWISMSHATVGTILYAIKFYDRLNRSHKHLNIRTITITTSYWIHKMSAYNMTETQSINVLEDSHRVISHTRSRMLCSTNDIACIYFFNLCPTGMFSKTYVESGYTSINQCTSRYRHRHLVRGHYCLYSITTICPSISSARQQRATWIWSNATIWLLTHYRRACI